MAELFGTLASAIGVVGVAVQCADGIKKLREYQKDVKNAPEEIGILIEQLDILSETVGSIGFQIQRSSQIAGVVDMTGPLRLCCTSVESTAAIVRDLNAEISVKRRRGALKAAWKRKEIEQLMGRVERCKTSLALAYSAFTREWQHLEFTMITGRLDQMQNTVVTFTQTSSVTRVSPPPAQGSLQITAPVDVLNQEQEKRNASHETSIRQDSYRKRRPPIHVATLAFSLPYWLLSRSLEIEVLRSTRGWSFNLKSQGVVSGDSDLFNACRYDTLTTMRNLVAEDKASILDVDPAGWSASDILLLYIGMNADTGLHPSMLEFAIDNGAMSAQHTHNQCHTWTSPQHMRLDDVLSMALHKAIDQLDVDMSVERLREVIETYGKMPSHVAFSVFNTYVSWYDFPLEAHLGALPLDFVTTTSPIDLDAWIDVESFEQIKMGCTPENYQHHVELLGRSIGESLAYRDEDALRRWRSLVARILEQCGDKQEFLEYTGVAAFRYRVEGIHYREWREIYDDRQITHQSIHKFAEEFRGLGAELISFGELLRNALVMDTSGQSESASDWWSTANRLVITRIAALKIGPEPEDWRVWLSDARADATVDVFG